MPMARRNPRAQPLPDGIGTTHIEPRHGLGGHASPLSIVVLAVVLAVALTGLAGGDRTTVSVDNAAIELLYSTPRIIRNGEILETVVRISAHRQIDKLVVGVEPGLWRELTVNSMVPGAASESYSDGFYRYAFDKLAPGHVFFLKIDQQVNPSLRGVNRGRIAIFDGDRRLADVSTFLRVLP